LAREAQAEIHARGGVNDQARRGCAIAEIEAEIQRHAGVRSELERAFRGRIEEPAEREQISWDCGVRVLRDFREIEVEAVGRRESCRDSEVNAQDGVFVERQVKVLRGDAEQFFDTGLYFFQRASRILL
jgi:hypothetical protein